MYTPPLFRLTDPLAQAAIIRQNSFALLVSTDSEAALHATHIPLHLICDEDGHPVRLIGHLAGQNPQLLHSAREVLAIFQGSHAYISPPQTDQVPTWNYAAVHVYGRLSLLADEEIASVLDVLTATYEGPEGWSTDQMPVASYQQMQKAITAFDIQITRLEGKNKMSQNKSAWDRELITNRLKASQNAQDHHVADEISKAAKR